VHGLTIGGDDYVTKPFSIEELMARVRVVLRRHGSDTENGKLSLADLELDDEAHEVRRHGHVVELTNTEYRLLRYLLINAGRVLTRSRYWTTCGTTTSVATPAPRDLCQLPAPQSRQARTSAHSDRPRRRVRAKNARK